MKYRGNWKSKYVNESSIMGRINLSITRHINKCVVTEVFFTAPGNVDKQQYKALKCIMEDLKIGNTASGVFTKKGPNTLIDIPQKNALTYRF